MKLRNGKSVNGKSVNGKYVNPIVVKKPKIIIKSIYTEEISNLIKTLKPWVDNYKFNKINPIDNVIQLIPIFDYLLIHIKCICSVNIKLTRLVDTISTKILSLKSELKDDILKLLYNTLDTNTIENLKIYINFLSLIDSVNNKIIENTIKIE